VSYFLQRDPLKNSKKVDTTSVKKGGSSKFDEKEDDVQQGVCTGLSRTHHLRGCCDLPKTIGEKSEEIGRRQTASGRS